MKRKKKSWKKRKAIWQEKELKKENHKNSRRTNFSTIPLGAIVSDLEVLAANNNTYGPLPCYYVDIEFTCVDCDKSTIYTAAQQKWWFEVAKGHIHSTAIRCKSCRAEIQQAKALQKQHMEDLAKKAPHPNEAFFRRRTNKSNSKKTVI